MEANTTNKLIFHQSYTLYGIRFEDAVLRVQDSLPHFRDIRITVSDETGDLVITFYTESEDQKHFNRTLKIFKKTFVDEIMTPPNTSLEAVFFQIMDEKKFHVSTAESCTGGLLAARIINVSGASSIIEEAFITYSEDAKMKVLGINKNILKKYGVVSSECAEEMARCLKKLTNCELCIAITGVAGPSGGTESIPVGTVCVSIGYLEKYLMFKKWFSGDRLAIRNKAVSLALSESIRLIKNENMI
jgi:PncC family amidohydrolase